MKLCSTCKYWQRLPETTEQSLDFAIGTITFRRGICCNDTANSMKGWYLKDKQLSQVLEIAVENHFKRGDNKYPLSQDSYVFWVDEFYGCLLYETKIH
jgi:hypothetical protein